jgi:hypothetical protein
MSILVWLSFDFLVETQSLSSLLVTRTFVVPLKKKKKSVMEFRRVWAGLDARRRFAPQSGFHKFFSHEEVIK